MDISFTEEGDMSHERSSPELIVELKGLDLCIPGCLLNSSHLRAPMVPCGLCERWFHFLCVGLPEGTPRSIRGLYFCQECLTRIRSRCLVKKDYKRRLEDMENRLEAAEATIQALELELAVLRERLALTSPTVGKLPDETVTRLGGRVVDASYAGLLLENARLMRKLAGLSNPAIPTVDRADLVFHGTTSEERAEKFEVVSKMQVEVQSDMYQQQLQRSRKVVATETAPMITNGVANVFRKRKIMSTSRLSFMHPDDDYFIKCEKCGKEYYGHCQIHGPMDHVHDSIVADDDLQKARHSIPAGLEIGVSCLPGAGLGVFASDADDEFEEGTVFGPYRGEKKPIGNLASEYCWKIVRKPNSPICIDGSDEATSNWMRFVNCANNEHQQNLTAFQYKGHIFYRAIKQIKKGSELLVWYGQEYGNASSATSTKPAEPLPTDKHMGRVATKRVKFETPIVEVESVIPAN